MSKDLISLIKEYYETYKTNPIYIPTATFRKKGVDENNTTLSIEKLRQDKIIEETHSVFGQYEKQKKLSELEHGKFREYASYLKKVVSEPIEKQYTWSFHKFLDYVPNKQELAEELSENPDDELKNSFESFVEIKINPKKLHEQLGQEKKIKFCITKEGAVWIISKETGGEFSYKPNSRVKQKIIEFFIKNKAGDKTSKIAKKLRIETQTLRKGIGKINTSIINNFELNALDKFILRRKPNGYCFNLKFEITFK